MKEEIALLLFHPIIVPESPIDLFRLHFKVFVQSVKSLLLQINLSLGSGITDLFVLLHLELVQFGMLWYS